ncbi:MAG: pentapeptide repeat-containing protein [Frankia sp.]|nr:pentapeptide repeat-containing protein [Frankia sp.]
MASILDGVTLSGARLGPLDLSDVVVDGSDLSNSTWTDVTARRVEFQACRATGWHVAFARLEDVAFLDCRLDFASMAVARTAGRVYFEGCTFRNASLAGRLDGFIFAGSKLDGVSFDASSAVGCDLQDARLYGARGLLTLRGARISKEQLADMAVDVMGELGIEVCDL